AFDRLPDREGLAYWIAQEKTGVMLKDVSSAFVAGLEFQSTYGTLNDGDFVDRMYQNILHRPADAAGKTYWQGQLGQGLSRGNML
ncbi:DUF4214 domain-containing protein, partial [Undibacterium sp. SXout7W]|uniref:DUF4214 domain-containing protein n=2 Tax=Undibacterium sp. SXout7W TaxID=3413049 RepID=UPI003BF091CB